MDLIIELPEAELDEVHGGINFVGAIFNIRQDAAGNSLAVLGAGGNASGTGAVSAAGGVATSGAGGTNSILFLVA